MKNLIILSLIFLSSSLSALTYQETAEAYEEALENQSVTIYMLKCRREEQRNELLRQSFKNAALKEKEKEKELDKTIQENFDRWSR